ncbi:MAG: hypothetical protein KAI47_11575, partial [Deltaproteobacteria bacterium]|nr:hypothetical protein [Deltaproteobacteria bacterium]
MSDYGVFSLLPPLVAMVLALATQNVILSLGIGVFSGFVLGAGGDLIIGLYASLEQGIFGQLASQAHASLVVLVLIIGGFVGLLEATGGLATFARRIASWVRGPVGAQLAVWVAGIGIFFSDSATPLILGPIFRPVLQKSGVSREKLAYILDSTASPVCVLVPFISWGIYTMSLFGQAHRQLGVTTDAFTTFMEVMPLQLYPILALVTVPLTILARRELGPMASAARSLGAYEADVLDRSGEALDAPKDPPLAGADGEAGARQAPLGVVVFPLIVLGATVAGLFLRVYLIQGKLGGPALTTSLTLAYLAATVVAVGLARRASLLSLKEGLGAFRRGVERMLIVPLILLLAWSLSHV